MTVLLCVFAIGTSARATEGGQIDPEFTEQIFLTQDAALKLAFSDCDRVEKKVHHMTRQEKEKIEARLGWALSESTVTIFEGFRENQPRGRGVAAEEIGKFKPITFMVKVSNEGKVERVDVMAYRETVGSEVRRRRFTGQFNGKSAKDPLRINRDVLNITGATMSVQAMTAGVRKVLVILDEIK